MIEKNKIQEIHNWNKYLSVVNPTLDNGYTEFKVTLAEFALLRARVLYTYENILYKYGMRQYIGSVVPTPAVDTTEFWFLISWADTHKNLIGI